MQPEVFKSRLDQDTHYFFIVSKSLVSAGSYGDDKKQKQEDIMQAIIKKTSILMIKLSFKVHSSIFYLLGLIKTSFNTAKSCISC